MSVVKLNSKVSFDVYSSFSIFMSVVKLNSTVSFDVYSSSLSLYIYISRPLEGLKE